MIEIMIPHFRISIYDGSWRNSTSPFHFLVLNGGFPWKNLAADFNLGRHFFHIVPSYQVIAQPRFPYVLVLGFWLTWHNSPLISTSTLLISVHRGFWRIWIACSVLRCVSTTPTWMCQEMRQHYGFRMAGTFLRRGWVEKLQTLNVHRSRYSHFKSCNVCQIIGG